MIFEYPVLFTAAYQRIWSPAAGGFFVFNSKSGVMKILYIQYAGDFREAYERLIVKGGSENYYGQQYSVDVVIQQARRGHAVMVLVLTGNGHDVELERNLCSVGLGDLSDRYRRVEEVVTGFCPDLVILRTPDYQILKALRKRGIAVFPVFADSFESIPVVRLKSWIQKFLLARELTKKEIRWVSNHQINASKSLRNLGVDASRILPYDWEHPDCPANWRKTVPDDLLTKKITVFYAGSVSVAKGVFDLVHAARYLMDSGRDFVMKIAGGGDLEALSAFALKQGVSEKIEVMGPISHVDVLVSMNMADVVVVPSHHAYAEGLPMTIMESLMVHTPVIASDHPMFVGRVGRTGSVVFFKEKSVKELAGLILSVCGDYEKYLQMSGRAEKEWAGLVLDLKWGEMINRRIEDEHHDFSGHTLKSLLDAEQ